MIRRQPFAAPSQRGDAAGIDRAARGRGAFRRALTAGEVTDDTPLRLDVAAQIAYPDGSMTGRALRREALRGRLVIERTAGKDYTTLRAIREMREKCRLAPRDPASGCAPPDETVAAKSATAPSISSSIKAANSRLDALTSRRPSKPSRLTSRQSIKPRSV